MASTIYTLKLLISWLYIKPNNLLTGKKLDPDEELFKGTDVNFKRCIGILKLQSKPDLFKRVLFSIKQNKIYQIKSME